jgi:DNA replicative helicase MCM subunit Mcm2 (Cdc46/Mcm family)
MANGAECIPLDILKDYIRYAREFCRPKLTSLAAEKLRDYYINMKTTHVNESSIPITTRQLER